MKHLIRTVLGGNTPGQSKAERKFRAKYHLVVRDVSNPSYLRWVGHLKCGKYSNLTTYHGASEQDVRDKATADIDSMWRRASATVNEKKVKRL